MNHNCRFTETPSNAQWLVCQTRASETEVGIPTLPWSLLGEHVPVADSQHNLFLSRAVRMKWKRRKSHEVPMGAGRQSVNEVTKWVFPGLPGSQEDAVHAGTVTALRRRNSCGLSCVAKPVKWQSAWLRGFCLPRQFSRPLHKSSLCCLLLSKGAPLGLGASGSAEKMPRYSALYGTAGPNTPAVARVLPIRKMRVGTTTQSSVTLSRCAGALHRCRHGIQQGRGGALYCYRGGRH